MIWFKFKNNKKPSAEPSREFWINNIFYAYVDFFMKRAAWASLPPSSRLALESSVDLRDNELNELQSQSFSASPAVSVRPEPIPSSLLPLVSYLLLLPRILFQLLMLSFPIYSQGNPLPAVWKPQHSNNLLLNEVLLNIERGNICGAVYLDQLTRAFETIDHKILMSKLSSLGVSPRSLQWFSSYLSNQKKPKPLDRMNYPKLFPLLSGFHKEKSWDRYSFLCISTSYLLLLNTPRYHCMLKILFFNASQKNLNSWRASWMQISTT